jgi:hypothetical protein
MRQTYPPSLLFGKGYLNSYDADTTLDLAQDQSRLALAAGLAFFLPAFLQTLLLPLFGPFLHPFAQHRFYLAEFGHDGQLDPGQPGGEGRMR